MAYITDKSAFGTRLSSGSKPKQAPEARRRLEFGTFTCGLPLMVAFLALWEIAPRLGWLNRIFFPPLSEVCEAWYAMLLDGTLTANIGISLQRAAIGFVLAVIVAVPLGFLMGRYTLFEKVSDLLVQTLRNTSQFALLPVFILLLGIGEASKIAITFYSSIFFLLINTISGVKSVDPLLLKAARSMGTSDLDMFRKVILPASIPSIVSGMRLAVKSSIFAVIGAEMLAAKSGLGFLIVDARNAGDRYDLVIAGMALIGILGVLLDLMMRRAERHDSLQWGYAGER